jgi:hypothetical protein
MAVILNKQGGTWIQQESGFWFFKKNKGAGNSMLAGLRRCVSCNKPIEHVEPQLERANHHCSEKHENILEGSSRSHEELGRLRSPPYWERLVDGFRNMRIAEYLGRPRN